MSLPFACHDPLAVYPAFPTGQDGLVVAAPAKLNLFLEIIGKRSDGYHDLESLMIAVDLFDTLEFQPADGISLTCEAPGLPTGPENLVVKAALALRTKVGRADLGIAIRLVKRIPAQAGLGGGSSDAAITLAALNRIWKLGLTRQELGGIASSIGSDVAFFLTPPAAWCQGRGEIVTPESLGKQLDFVLVCPAIGLATAAVYGRLKPPASPRTGEAIRSALRNGDAEAIGREMYNRLGPPAFELAPAVEKVQQRLSGLSPFGAMLSGSGSAFFAPCRSREEAIRVANRFRVGRPEHEPSAAVFVVRSLAP